MKLYHYTSLEHFKGIWSSQKLKFASSRVPSNNDIFERRKSYCFSEGHNLEAYLAMFAEENKDKKYPNPFFYINMYKQISFTMNYEDGRLGCLSPMMWGQYADCGQGVCIEFDSEKLNLVREGIWAKPINYVDKQHSFMPDSFIDSKAMMVSIEKNIDTIFFEKHKDWVRENEFRVISNKFIDIDISSAVTRIIISNYKGETAKQVKRHVSDLSKIYYINITTNGDTSELRVDSIPS